MRAVTTTRGIGLVDGDEIALLDVPHPDLGAALADGVELGELATAPVRERVSRDALRLRAPVPSPSKVWIVGYAYRAHRVETGHAASDGREDGGPQVFLLAPSAITGPYDPVVIPPLAPTHVDFEGELAVVIGRRATRVRESQAWQHIAGFTIADDVSARDVQRGKVPGWPASPSTAKSFDTFLPLGPSLVTPDEFDDPEDLLLQTWVDGELRQSARTSDLIYSIPFLVSHLSQVTTLLPGDVICTGTPGGVGGPENRFLGPGSCVRVEIEGIGAIENRFVSAEEHG